MEKILRGNLPLGKRLIYKYLLMTKFFIFFMFITSIQSFAKGYGQETVTLKLEKEKFKNALKAIESQSVYRFVYKDNIFPKDRKVSIDVTNANINHVLLEMFKNTSLSFKFISEKLIVISTDTDNALLSETVKNITGKIVNEKGEPLEGVTVRVKNTNVITTTNSMGIFSLETNELSGTLVISYVGMQTVEIPMAGKTEFAVSLKAGDADLSEVVVLGYGTQKRAKVTGAISRISNEDITAVPVADVRQALQGRVPGVVVTANGSPGEAPIVRIRGIGSINYSSEPFYVVDGFPGADMSMIDGKDIESIDVLRDASTAAIYGSRAANGVIIVTTKKGRKSDKIRVMLDSYYGFQKAWKKLDLLNTEEYVRYATDLLTNAGATLPARFSKLDDPIYAGATQTYRQTNTDWQDEMFRTAPVTQTNIGLTTSNANSRMYASAGYFKQDGIMLGTQYERFNFRINSDHNIGKVFTFGQTLTLASENKLNENNAGGRSQLKHIIHNVPYIPVKDPTRLGGYRGPSGDDGSDPQNPVRIALQDISRNKLLKILGSAFVEAKILNGLKYRFTAGVNYSNFVNNGNAPIYNESFNARGTNQLQQTISNFRSIYLSNQLNYERSFGNHNINVLAVAESQNGKSTFLFGGGNYTTNELRYVTSSISDPGVNGGISEELLYSYLGRINYDYKGKYLLSGSFRRDGSSVFAPGNKWANFPSLSAGWRVSEEAFLSSSKAISELKLRASWGKMGFNGIGNYAWQPVLLQSTGAILGDSRQTGAFFNALGNSDLKWEITTMTNFGIDLGFLQNRLTFSAEYYLRKTEGLILQTPLPSSLGFSNSTPANVGEMENKGFELQAGYAKRTGKFTWDINANISTIKNKVVSFGENIKSPIFAGANGDFGAFDITRTTVGEAIQTFYGWKVAGIFQTQAEIDAANALDGNTSTKYQDNAKPGDIRFQDLDGNGVINGDDRTNLGSFLPKISYGFNYAAKYGNFDFTVFFQGVQGNSVYNGTKVLTQGMLRLFGAGKEVLNAWSTKNTDTNIPRAVSGDPNNNSRTSDRFVEDGSYLRLKVLSVGYIVAPKSLSGFAKGTFNSVRVYVSAQNLLTITKYTGYDPEVGSRFNGALSAGIDYGQFPQPRSFLFGLQVGF